MKVSNWRLNEEQAAQKLGLALHERDQEEVHTLDLELDDGSRVLLTLLSDGAMSVQLFRDSSRGRPLWHLSGSTIVEAPDLTDFARTVLAGDENSSKRPQTASKSDEKTTSEKVAQKAKEITV